MISVLVPDDQDMVREGFAALLGAQGDITVAGQAGDGVEAVRVVAAGDALLAPSVTRRLIEDFARHRQPKPLSLNGLTARETEMLSLIAHGLTNQEIAGKLTVAEQTVKTHIGRILAKLGLRDRAQAVIVAYESGLVVPRRDAV